MNTRSRNTRILCLIFAVSIFVFCIHTVSADTIYSYARTSLSSSGFQAVHPAVQSDYCSERQLGISESTHLVSALRTISAKAARERVIPISLLALFPQNLTTILASPAADANSAFCIRNAIIQYIHHQNGAKG